MEINFQQVGYCYHGDSLTQALKNVNLSFNPKDITIILGPTGAGKSTLLEHLNALLIPTNGHVRILGQVVSQKKQKPLKHLRRLVGLSFQFPEYQLFAETVLDDIAFGPRNFKETKRTAIALAKTAAKELNISNEMLKEHPLKLSGGQMRLIALAGIVAMNPKMLVLDEPTRGLDNNHCNLIKQEIKYLYDLGKGIIIVTHDVDLALELGTRFIILNNGQVRFDGSKKEFLAIDNYHNYGLKTPTNFYLAELINNNFKTNIGRVETIKELAIKIAGEIS